MKKACIEFLASLLLFLAVLLAFSQVDWLSLFRLERTSVAAKLSESYWKLFASTQQFVQDECVTLPLDSLLAHICHANGIDPQTIQLHVVQTEELNAFAFPGRNLVLYTGLLEACESEAELCGVMAHEVAHMEKGHIMRKLVKELGLSVLISASGGNGEVLKSLVKTLSSTAYDRTLEAEADELAVDYLLAAEVDPLPFGEFLQRLSEKDVMPSVAEWVSTHPDSEKRAAAVRERTQRFGASVEFRPVLSATAWEDLKWAIR